MWCTLYSYTLRQFITIKCTKIVACEKRMRAFIVNSKNIKLKKGPRFFLFFIKFMLIKQNLIPSLLFFQKLERNIVQGRSTTKTYGSEFFEESNLQWIGEAHIQIYKERK